MKVGDLVKMREEASVPGVITEIHDPLVNTHPVRYVAVYWSDKGRAVEKMRDLKVINENR